MASKTFYLIGNQLSLDFVNTLVAQDGAPVDLLAELADFVAWAAQAELIDGPQAGQLTDAWKGKSAAARLAQVREFRETLRRVIVAFAHGQTIKKNDLTQLNARLREQRGYAEIVKAGGAYEKRFHAHYAAPLDLLAPLAESAADLLCYGNPAYVRKCENPNCVLYFYDTTKNHTRRWCSMQVCGNRAKAAAFYLRSKQGSKQKPVA